MKKILLIIFALPILFYSCEDNEGVLMEQNTIEVDMSDFYLYTEIDPDALNKGNSGKKKNCQSMVVLNRKLKENPGLYQRMYDVEKHTRKAILAKGKPAGSPGGGNGGGGGGGGSDPVPFTGSVSIPVVINILEDFQGQVSNAQISSQIAILNEDFKCEDFYL